jgi:hypothetical protein
MEVFISGPCLQAIRAQQFPDLLEESCIVWNADMLEHSD